MPLQGWTSEEWANNIQIKLSGGFAEPFNEADLLDLVKKYVAVFDRVSATFAKRVSPLAREKATEDVELVFVLAAGGIKGEVTLRLNPEFDSCATAGEVNVVCTFVQAAIMAEILAVVHGTENSGAEIWLRQLDNVLVCLRGAPGDADYDPRCIGVAPVG